MSLKKFVVQIELIVMFIFIESCYVKCRIKLLLTTWLVPDICIFFGETLDVLFGNIPLFLKVIFIYLTMYCKFIHIRLILAFLFSVFSVLVSFFPDSQIQC